MSNAFELPLRIRIYPPKWLAAGLIVSHLGAVAILGTVQIPSEAKVLLIIVIIISLIYVLRLYIWQKSKWSPLELILNDKEEWYLTLASGEIIQVDLRPGAFVHPILVILPFRHGIYFPTVILTPSSVDQDTLRRLRVRLKYKRVVIPTSG